MMNPIKDRISTDFEQVKTQGGTRIDRVWAIVRAAAFQAMTKVKAGSGEIRDITSGTFSKVVENLSNGSTGSSTDELSSFLLLKQRAANLFISLKSSLSGQINRQDQDTPLAEAVTQRYGTAVKQYLTETTRRYRQEIAMAEAQGVDLLQNQQMQIESKAGQVGGAIARQELKIKRQLKAILKTTLSRP
jgi:hypothetical protein